MADTTPDRLGIVCWVVGFGVLVPLLGLLTCGPFGFLLVLFGLLGGGIGALMWVDIQEDRDEREGSSRG